MTKTNKLQKILNAFYKYIALMIGGHV